MKQTDSSLNTSMVGLKRIEGICFCFFNQMENLDSTHQKPVVRYFHVLLDYM